MHGVVVGKVEEHGDDGELVLNPDALLSLLDILLTLGLLRFATLEAFLDPFQVL